MHSLGYTCNFDIIIQKWSYQPKIKVVFSKQKNLRMWIIETWRDIHIPQKPYIPVIQEMSNYRYQSLWSNKHAIMRNRECTSKMYSLHEGVHNKKTSTSKYQILETIGVCDIAMGHGILWSNVSKLYLWHNVFFCAG